MNLHRAKRIGQLPKHLCNTSRMNLSSANTEGKKRREVEGEGEEEEERKKAKGKEGKMKK